MHDDDPRLSALTRRQRELYTLLRSHPFPHPPSLDELCDVLGLRSRGSLHKQVQALVEAGLVEPQDGRQRGVRLTTPSLERGHCLPWLGYIAAGRPIEALENPEPIEVPETLCVNPNAYVLRVRGESMIEQGILDGDWVVIEPRTHARNGEVVVALIDGSEATLKRIEQRPDAVLLHPANPAFATQSYRPGQVAIQGVLIAQMRRY